MESGLPTTRRAKHLDDIAAALPQRAATLARLFRERASITISGTETGVLGALAARPRRITELARREGVTQPAITLLVNRLEDRGWVTRDTDPEDARAVLVALTPTGREVIDRLRGEYRALLHEEMATLPDEDVETLAAAVEVLDRVIERLDRAGRP
jgi:DNA-binding MarR family transcriptional regulator